MFIFSLHYNRTESTSKQYASSYGQDSEGDTRCCSNNSGAVQLFVGSGGQLTTWPEFGIDPLSCDGCQSSARRKHFHSHFPDFLTVFENVVNGNPPLFQNAIQLFRDLTYEYCS